MQTFSILDGTLQIEVLFRLRVCRTFLYYGIYQLNSLLTKPEALVRWREKHS